tara:strand:- start:5107 stop:5313 length:207 start_codon:yes stop_codon:yes gene_type:complete
MTAFDRAWDLVKRFEGDEVCPKCNEAKKAEHLCWDCELCHDCCDCPMVASWDGQSKDVDWERERRKIP